MEKKIEGNGKRIAKNTIVLYLRSFVVLLLSLYTARLVLAVLGVDDFGLYNVVGGVVTLFSFFKTSLTKSIQRFLNVEMTKTNSRQKNVFKVGLTLHFFIALITLFFAETIGLWFINTQMNIPEGREIVANIVYQTTVVSLLATLISVPYNASIIAREKMTFFAIVSIVDAVLKLGIAYLILAVGQDKLIVYSFLLMGVSFVNLIMYVIYCRGRFEECCFGFLWEKQLVREMLGYTTWTFVGQTAIVGTNQGNNILVNMFHSVSANAAMGVATQVNHAVLNLTANFQTAFNPQITKSFALKDFEYLKSLVYTTSKISFFLLMVVSLPLALKMDVVLSIWLKTVPAYSSEFCILMLCNSILNALSTPLNFCVLSSHKIKWFQIVTSIVYLSDLAILYCLFSFGSPAVTALYVKVSIMVVILFVRLYYCHKVVDCINFTSYCKAVLFPLTLSSTICIACGFGLNHILGYNFPSLIFIALYFITICCVVYVFGLKTEEKELFKEKLKKIRRKRDIRHASN